jgi:ATP-binding cassette subfamily B (MDR/TAP) protein 1
MDNTGGDLAHAAAGVQEVIEVHEEKVIEQETATTHTTTTLNEKEGHSRHDSVGEKAGAGVSSSGSSSHDPKDLEKYDSQVVNVKDADDPEAEYAHLPPHEKEIIKRQLFIPPISASYKTLFRYATRNDILIIILSAACAIIGGAVMPLMTVSVPRARILISADIPW